MTYAAIESERFDGMNTPQSNTARFHWRTTRRPIVALAPMAGFTDTAFRRVVRSVSPETILFTEFTSTDGLSHQSAKSFEQIAFHDEEHPVIVQIFGKHPEHFRKIAALIQERGADGIDINMGCPTRNARTCMYGSALLTDPELACTIVKNARSVLQIPLSVKTRIGQDQYEYQYLEKFILTLEDLGVDNITIHGRTGKQKYSGESTYEPLYRIKERIGISLIGSGDIVDKAGFDERLGNLDGLMIGRGAMGNPWIFEEIITGIPRPELFQHRIPVILRHAANAFEFRGTRGLLQFRKHLSAYVKGLANSKELRIQLMHADSIDAIASILHTARDYQRAPEPSDAMA